METITFENKLSNKEQIQTINDVDKSDIAKSEEEVDIPFTIFNLGEETVDLGLGVNVRVADYIDKAKNEVVNSEVLLDEEPKITNNPKVIKETIEINKQDCLKVDTPKEELKEDKFTPGLYINDEEVHFNEEVNTEMTNINEYKKRIQEINVFEKEIVTPDIEITIEKSNLELVEVQNENLDFKNFEQLERAYEEATAIVKEKIVEVDKITFADRVGKVINWFSQNFIIYPIKGVLKMAYALIFNVLSSLENLLKILLLSIVFTTVLYVLLTYINPEFSAQKSAITTWDTMKELIITIIGDVKGLLN
ncbi:hypothetical protein MKY04_18120 [Lysinibacillus telephonicus]|uniref:hypothetical protein n=1 Tax=Lysinibacillus telephonicus TaxID=1714840 RepID=UPI0031FD5395